jgi:hypothetical protein
MTTKWIQSAGGPLVFMHERVLRTWWGVYHPHDSVEEVAGNAATDYDRACLVAGEIDSIKSRLGEAVLVLGDEPDLTTLRSVEGNHYLIRWRAAASKQAMEEALNRSLRELAFEHGAPFQTAPGKHVLFDAACAGWTPDATLVCQLEKASYMVDSAFLREGSTAALIHRLTPMPV